MNNKIVETATTTLPQLSHTVARTRLDYDKFVIEHSYHVSIAGGLLGGFTAIVFACLFYFAGFVYTEVDLGVMVLMVFASTGTSYTIARIASLQKQQEAYQLLITPPPPLRLIEPAIPSPAEPVRAFVPQNGRTTRVMGLAYTPDQWQAIAKSVFASQGKVTRDVFAKAGCIPKLSENWPAIKRELETAGVIVGGKLTPSGAKFFGEHFPLPQNYNDWESVGTPNDDDDDSDDEHLGD